MIRALALTLALALAGPVAASDLITVPGGTPRIEMANRDAHASLDLALRNVSTGKNRLHPAFNLKVAIPTGQADHSEVIWVERISRTSKGFAGRFANQPVYLKGKSAGDRVTFRREMIADWGLAASDGTLWGHFTTRALLPDADPETRRYLKQILSKTPVPRNWK